MVLCGLVGHCLVWFGKDLKNMSQYKRNNNELLKEQCLEYLGGKSCAICSTMSLPICCYDFHHKIGAKEENISQMIQRKRILDQELKNELDKCAVVCSNCHRMITHGLVDNEILRSLHNK